MDPTPVRRHQTHAAQRKRSIFGAAMEPSGKARADSLSPPSALCSELEIPGQRKPTAQSKAVTRAEGSGIEVPNGAANRKTLDGGTKSVTHAARLTHAHSLEGRARGGLRSEAGHAQKRKTVTRTPKRKEAAARQKSWKTDEQ